MSQRKVGHIEHGRVLDVRSVRAGSQLTQDELAGAGTLHVEDTVDFDEEGGLCTLGNEILTFTAVDDETDIVTLSGTTDADHAEEDLVLVWPHLSIRYADVRIQDQEDEEVTVRVPRALQKELALGVRDEELGQCESVLLIWDGSEWMILDVLGEKQGFGGEEIQDCNFVFYTLTYRSEPDDDDRIGIPFGPDASGTIIAALAELDNAASEDYVIDVTLNGSSFVTLLIATGETSSGVSTTSQDIVDGDILRVEQTDAAGDNFLTVKLRVRADS